MERTICAIDTETTNINCLLAEAVEVTFLPLTSNFEIDPKKKPFTTLINPGIEALEAGIDALAFNKINVEEIFNTGVPKKEYQKLLEKWMIENKIECVEPLAHNWVYDRVVFYNLLGFDVCEKLIYRRGHDSHSLAIAIKDMYLLNGLDDPFYSTKLVDLAKHFGMDNTGAHRSLKDCQMTTFVYKKLLEMIVPSEKI